MSSTDRAVGKIKMTNQDKGFGFIRRAGTHDLFFHISECNDRLAFKDMKEGTDVMFSVGPGKRGEEGRAVEVIQEELAE